MINCYEVVVVSVNLSYLKDMLSPFLARSS